MTDPCHSVTAGILALIFKKRKWDHIRRREEALLALHAPPTYDSSSDNNNTTTTTTTTTDNGDRWTSTSLPGRKVHPSSPIPSVQYQVSRDIEEQPPAYETHAIPVYDPSRYHQQQQHYHNQHHFRPASALTINSGYLHHLTNDPAHAPRPSSQLSAPFRGYRHTMQGGLEGAGIRSSSARGQDHRQERRAVSRLNSSSSVPVDMNDTSSNNNGPGTGTRPPRKPKPVLSRLITNFG